VNELTERLAVTSDQDVVRVRQLVRTVAVVVKLSLVDQTKLVTAASELARNTLFGQLRGTLRPLATRPEVDLVVIPGGHALSGRGTGLGLPYALRLVGILGGALRVVSQPGKGSTFTVSLPAGPP
jgi:serine/threonine-protein kinase RsbT